MTQYEPPYQQCTRNTKWTSVSHLRSLESLTDDDSGSAEKKLKNKVKEIILKGISFRLRSRGNYTFDEMQSLASTAGLSRKSEQERKRGRIYPAAAAAGRDSFSVMSAYYLISSDNWISKKNVVIKYHGKLHYTMGNCASSSSICWWSRA